MSISVGTPGYAPELSLGTRVWVFKTESAVPAEGARIIRALDNPSNQTEHQWYDVRFDNGKYGRFRSPFLRRIDDRFQGKS